MPGITKYKYNKKHKRTTLKDKVLSNNKTKVSFRIGTKEIVFDRIDDTDLRNIEIDDSIESIRFLFCNDLIHFPKTYPKSLKKLSILFNNELYENMKKSIHRLSSQLNDNDDHEEFERTMNERLHDVELKRIDFPIDSLMDLKHLKQIDFINVHFVDFPIIPKSVTKLRYVGQPYFNIPRNLSVDDFNFITYDDPDVPMKKKIDFLHSFFDVYHTIRKTLNKKTIPDARRRIETYIGTAKQR